MLFAEVPEQPASASPWRLYDGFHWRLHVHHRTRYTAGLALSVVRESNFSNVRISAQVRVFSDRLLEPVRNLAFATKENCPHERNLTVQLPASIASESVKLFPIAVPLGRFVAGISLNLQEFCVEDGGQSRRTSLSVGRRVRVERFSDPYSIERSITWLEETKYLSEPTRKNVDLFTENDDSFDGETVPYNLSTLLESCNQRTKGHVQTSDVTFSDVTLIAGSGANMRAFNLHRCILALASPVFRAMLTSEMIENLTGVVTLSNFSPSAVEVAVRYIYGSPVNVTLHAFELYRFAHQFDIVSLRRRVRKAVLQEMGLRSCARLLRFGIAFRDEEVVSVACDFIAARFTDIIWDGIAVREMDHIPTESFLRLLEDDMIKATEFEILLYAMRWLATNERTAARDVLKRIRWGLISPKIPGLTKILGFSSISSERAAVGQSQNNKKFHDEEHRRRRVGKPNITLCVPLIRRPPAAFFPSKRLLESDNKRRTSRWFNAAPSRHSEASFDHSDLKWALRAKLEECNASSCCGTRLSASLWLEEGDDGKVLTKDGRNPLPVRVLANLMVWNRLGGQLHIVPVNVVFRSAGWGNGWCVRDLLGGGKHGLADYGEVVQVAVEIRELMWL